MNKLLVCEGSCNPQLPDLDREVAEIRREESRRRMAERGVVPLYGTIAARLRQLVHTWHTPQPFGAWTCSVCGRERIFK